MRFFSFSVVMLIRCGASTTGSLPTDGAVDGPADSGAVNPASDSSAVDTAFAVDAPPISSSCSTADPLNPPIPCGPTEEGAEPCSSTTNVATCPTDNACMAPVKQSGSRLSHRVGRLRLWAPNSLISLAAIMVDPAVNAKCVNYGSEGLSWLLQIDTTTNTLTTGSSRASADGRTFGFLSESFDGSSAGTLCPGFVGPTTPMRLAPMNVALVRTGTGFITDRIAGSLNIAIFDTSGLPIVLPLREAQLRVPTMSDPSCIGSWNKAYWCDGTTLGWSNGGVVTAKISVEEADRIPIRAAGCQSLCAILANDATKTDGKVCKRGPDGKVPEIGNACIGGTSCKNAWLFSATFGSYGVTITP